VKVQLSKLKNARKKSFKKYNEKYFAHWRQVWKKELQQIVRGLK